MDWQAEGTGNGKRREAMLLGFVPDGAFSRGRAYAPNHRTSAAVGEAAHETI
jgi:hypothetical protein